MGWDNPNPDKKTLAGMHVFCQEVKTQSYSKRANADSWSVDYMRYKSLN